jgi:hypothetical protein
MREAELEPWERDVLLRARRFRASTTDGTAEGDQWELAAAVLTACREKAVTGEASEEKKGSG